MEKDPLRAVDILLSKSATQPLERVTRTHQQNPATFPTAAPTKPKRAWDIYIPSAVHLDNVLTTPSNTIRIGIHSPHFDASDFNTCPKTPDLRRSGRLLPKTTSRLAPYMAQPTVGGFKVAALYLSPKYHPTLKQC